MPGKPYSAHLDGLMKTIPGTPQAEALQASPQVGDIWFDLTVGYPRYVCVSRVGTHGVFIYKVEWINRGWSPPKRSVVRETSIARFNSKAGGFRLHYREGTGLIPAPAQPIECDCVDECNGPDTTDRQCRAENGTF